MIGIGIIIGLVLMTIIMPFLVMLELEADTTPKEKHTKGMKIYVWIRDFLTN